MKKRIFFLIALVLSIFTLLCGCESENNPDPNRTEEKCTYFGTTRVFGTEHQIKVHCTPDGDGWYNPVFGHHHHK